MSIYGNVDIAVDPSCFCANKGSEKGKKGVQGLIQAAVTNSKGDIKLGFIPATYNKDEKQYFITVFFVSNHGKLQSRVKVLFEGKGWASTVLNQITLKFGKMEHPQQGDLESICSDIKNGIDKNKYWWQN